jgi:hypothetical protein
MHQDIPVDVYIDNSSCQWTVENGLLNGSLKKQRTAFEAYYAHILQPGLFKSE